MKACSAHLRRLTHSHLLVYENVWEDAYNAVTASSRCGVHVAEA